MSRKTFKALLDCGCTPDFGAPYPFAGQSLWCPECDCAAVVLEIAIFRGACHHCPYYPSSGTLDGLLELAVNHTKAKEHTIAIHLADGDLFGYIPA